MRYLTAGESHGPAISGILEGMPANVPINFERVQHELQRRMQGFGRGGRMRLETDTIETLSGIRFSNTLGSPISFLIHNRDWANWQEEMAVESGKAGKEFTKPRPGHADLAGSQKYNFDDLRNVLERSSARETAMRVAVGAFVKELLYTFDIHIFSHIIQIGTVKADIQRITDKLNGDVNKLADASEVRCLDPDAEKQMIDLIKETKSAGDTLGGIIQLIIRNVPPGLGSYVHWDRKLDAQLASAIMSVNAIKGVQIGTGFSGVHLPGSQFHDEIYYDKHKYRRKTNHAGGIEGGMSTGEDIVIHIMKKPIPTLMKPLESVDIKTKESFKAHKERSDITAVPAAGVIAEAAAAPIIANALMEKFGSDTLADIKLAYENYLKRI
ncbi:MAG: chorismate synthase [Calditrichaceae bacterium]|nr:chorismate synthase [Calditrichaceae bacterium]